LNLGFLSVLAIFAVRAILLSYPRSAQRKAETLEELAAFFVVVRGSGQGDVHALDLVDARVINFRKDQLIFQTQRVVAATIESVRRQASRVADTRKNHVAKAVDEFVHFVPAQSDRATDGHAFADLEVGDGLLGAGDDRLLPRDLAQFHSRSI